MGTTGLAGNVKDGATRRKPVLGSCPDSPLALQKRNNRQPKDGALLYLAVGLAIQAKIALF